MNDIAANDTLPDFLAGGGDMGERIRTFDWTGTPLGHPQNWPQGLRTATRLLLTTQHPMLIWWGSELIQLYNDAYRRTLGVERHPSALGQRGRDCWDEVWPIIGPQVEQVMANQGATWHENQRIPTTRNGVQQDIYWTYSYGPINEVTAANGVGGILVICAETTPIVMAERRHIAERQRLEQMFAQSPNFMALLEGPEHRIQLANASYLRLVGRQDVIGRTVAQALPDAVEQGYLDLLNDVYRSGAAFSSTGARFVVHASASDQVDERYLDFVYQPITDDAGNVTGIFIEGSDATERVHNEQALHSWNETLELRVADALAERKVFADVFESTDSLILVLDLDFRVLAINESGAAEFEELYAKRPKPGDSLLDLARDKPQHARVLEEQWRRALAGEEFTFLRHFDDAPEGPRTYETKFKSLIDRAGHRVGAYAVSANITERMNDQRRLLEAEEKILQAQKIEAIGQLTGGVAHDFNNLLMVISSGLDMMDRQSDPARRQRVLDAMRQAVDRGATLTRQLLTFSRRQKLQPEPIDLALRVTDMREMLDRSLRGDIHVQMDFQTDIWPAEVDPGELELAVLNLAVNARDAMAGGGMIRIRGCNLPDVDDGELRGDFVSLSVADEGSGMSAEVISRVFEPFFTTKDVGKGSGLGLAQVHGFAHASGGTVKICSEVGQGTTVSMLLPRTLKLPPPVAAALHTVLPAQATRSAGVALLVDDDDSVAALVGDLFGQLGYETLRVASAEAALGALADHRTVDVVFSDVMMPGAMNGLQLALEIRRRHPGLPVLLTSGFADAIKLEAAQQHIALLPKPYRLDELDTALRQIRGAANAASPNISAT
jgi:signal transduction histidine kinase/CheY-like chemotaxis protein